MTEDITKTRKTLELGGTLRWFHWLIVFASLLLTIGAWYFSKTQLEAKISLQFEREADQVVALIVDRMKKYEDALWSGVALIQTNGGEVTYSAWETFATSIRIEKKYPGINGIGVIHRLNPDQLDSYLQYQQAIRPDYRIHPPHQETEYWPITYVVPVGPNAKAVGLDMAHEANRFTAGKKARDTGLAQITGPITLVQDTAKTPGFLFYAPFYSGGRYESIETRRDHFVGMVYAPFIVNKLMQGVLAQDNRHVGLRMADHGDVLYDEHNPDNPDFDSHPLFQKEVTVPLYGRDWMFDIRSTQAFRVATTNSQPIIILVGGLIIDGLLLGLFILLSRGSRKALDYADVASRDLTQEHHRLQAVMATAVDGIITIDAYGNIQDCNPAASKIFGYQPEEMVGQNVKMLMPSPYHEGHDGYLNRYQQTGVPNIIGSGGRELIGQRKDGTTFPMDLSVGEMQCDGQAFYSGLVRDITERKEAERLQVETNQQIIDGAQRLKAVLDTAVDGIITIDAQGIMQDCNPAASKIFGYSPEEMAGQNVKMLMPSPYHEEHDAYLERYQETAVPHIIGIGARDLVGLRKDGTTFPMDLSVGEMQCDGQTFYSGLVRDITERKEAEEALKDTNEELERFAYIASHDLKAPLRVIDNTSKWLEEDLAEYLTGDNRENMDLMRSRVARMEKLLDDLLEYSRVGRATDDRYQERVNGATLVSEIVELLAPPEGFSIQVSPTFASIHVIKMPLQQILLNLINNALKHHDQSHGLIQVEVEDQGSQYRFTVSDDGPGIPHAFHEQVFDMFQTLKPRDQVEGSGMGLALVKKHIDLVGGTVHLESVEGEGSMFTIHWPKQYAMEEQPA